MCIVPLLLAVVAVIGCGGGGDDLPDVVPVSGKVTLNGEPLKGAAVTFIGSGRPCYGATSDDGTYTIKDLNGREGCPVGKYKVSFPSIPCLMDLLLEKTLKQGHRELSVCHPNIVPMKKRR